MKLTAIAKTIWNAILDFVLPRSCIACKEEIQNSIICNNCINNIIIVNSPRCPICGRSIKNTKTCKYCRYEKHLDYGRAWALYVPPLDNIIHYFKYRRFKDLAHLLGLGMANIVKYDLRLKTADLIVPVPLFWWKTLRRGYNQSQLLANIISQECGMEIYDALSRIKNTRTQTRLSDDRRCKNVFNAFKIKANGIQDKSVLLVDDVMTTGATVKECARILKKAGAARVYSVVAGITPA